MSIHFDKASGMFVIRFRDGDGRNCRVTVNEKNLTKYGQFAPDRITERVAKKLEQAVLASETAPEGSIRSQAKQKMLWLEVVARYLPPVLDRAGNDTWEDRPPEKLVNPKGYSGRQLDRMQRILTCYFPGFLNHGHVHWTRHGKKRHYKAEKIHACARTVSSVTPKDVSGFQIHLSECIDSAESLRGYMTCLKTFLAWCVGNSCLRENPAEGLVMPSRKRAEVDEDELAVRYLDEKEVGVLRKAVDGTILDGPVRAILGLGLRRAEMARLKWADVNFESGMVTI